jgi:hypothetical protein
MTQPMQPTERCKKQMGLCKEYDIVAEDGVHIKQWNMQERCDKI